MTDQQIPTADLYLADPNQSGAHVPLADFLAAGAALRKTLRQIERCISDEEPHLELDVADLRLSSAAMSVRPFVEGEEDKHEWVEISSILRDTCQRLESGRKDLDHRIDYLALSAFHDFGATIKRGRATVTVSGVRITQRFLTTLEAAMEPIPPTKGSVSGTVEQLDVHGKHTFVLFPAIPGNEIKCVFRKRDFEMVRNAVRRHVTVFGTLHYGLGRPFPVKAIMESLDIHPADSELPTLASMAGMLRGNIDGDSVSVIRAIRDEWK